MIFEREIMREMFGATRTADGYWRIEINDIMKGKKVFGFVKKRRLNWLGHVERVTEDNIVQKIKRWKPLYKDQLVDLKHVGNMACWKI